MDRPPLFLEQKKNDGLESSEILVSEPPEYAVFRTCIDANQVHDVDND